jgi:molecular chaperone DnaK (HSP70)
MRDAYIEQGERRDLNLVIDAAWTAPLWDPLFERALAAVDETLARAGWSDADVDEVMLIGGTSLVPRFQQHVRRRFAQVAVSSTDIANVAVAMGATLLTSRHGAGDSDGVPVLDAASA